MIHIEDYEHAAQKDLMYVQEEAHAFFNSLNDFGKTNVEVFLNSDIIELGDLQRLQEKAIINVCIPTSLINKVNNRIRKYEHKIKSFSF